jgi:hypothetical protein
MPLASGVVDIIEGIRVHGNPPSPSEKTLI